jgi:conjugal transfer ATP-binding protein TraC
MTAASDLATALAPYMAGGTYGAFFEGQASLDLDTDFTVFEMSDLATARNCAASSSRRSCS